jgi:hypothetical protein
MGRNGNENEFDGLNSYKFVVKKIKTRIKINVDGKEDSNVFGSPQNLNPKIWHKTSPVKE